MNLPNNNPKAYLQTIVRNLLNLSKKFNLNFNQTILVALSGGVDSTALLLALTKLQTRFNFTIVACHINHNLRGSESERDELYCQKLCQSLKIEFLSFKLKPLPNTKKQQSEEYLRKARYKILSQYAKRQSIKYIFTAHTLNDQTETMLFRLFRGTAVKGFLGIPVIRQYAKDLFIIRAMLNLTKDQNESFLRNYNLGWCNDTSNNDLKYTRNYIRHKIIPVIQDKFKNYANHLINFKNYLAHQEDFVQVRLHKYLAIIGLVQAKQNLIVRRLNQFIKIPDFVKTLILSYCLKELAIEINQSTIKRILKLIKISQHTAGLKPKSERLSLSKHYDLIIIKNKLIFCFKTLKINLDLNNYPCLNINPTGITIIPWLNKVLNIYPYKSSEPLSHNAYADTVYVNLDLNQNLYLRLRRPGDVIQPLGMTKIVKLKKYLHTHKNITNPLQICNPLNVKSKLLLNEPKLWFVLANDHEVLWVPGLGISEKLRYNLLPSHRISLNSISPNQYTV